MINKSIFPQSHERHCHSPWIYGAVLLLLISVLWVANLFIGSVFIPPSQVFSILLGEEGSRASWSYIIWESRLPQSLTALLSGMALGASGLLLQTAFRNPLAGPSILGINTGAGLGVALVMLAGGGTLVAGEISYSGCMSIILGAFLGAAAVMALLLFLSTFIRSSLMLLIAGIMIGYIASSAIALLNFFATAEGVHSYLIWGMGSFSGVSLVQLPFFSAVIIAGLLISLLLIKPLNALLLGARYAENLGVNIRHLRTELLLVTGLLVAVVTAFCGPIAFLGLAVPHIARLFLGTSNHNSLLPLTMLTGGALALLCQLICVLPGEASLLPLGAVTPLVGAPVILYVLINQRKIQYFN